ncbi:MAG: DNA polymerase III subunit delta [Prevotella sp.]|jgi:DNA polymerase-3 subunit delta
MAERKQTVTYESIMRDLKNRKFAPIYILQGEEAYYIDKISDYLAENVLKPEERDFNQVILFGADTTDQRVVDEARAYPMMADHRLIIVKESQNLKGDANKLARYFEKPVPTTILVFCHKGGKIDGRSQVAKKIPPSAVVFESKKKRDYELPGVISGYLKMHQASIDEKAAQMIADHIGSDLHRMTSELDKVLISLPKDNRRVTPEVVEHEIGVSKDFNGFELRDAIANKQIFKANQIIDYFDKNSKTAGLFILLPTLYNYFQNLMIAYYTPGQKTEASVAQYLDLKSPWAARPYLIGMRNYSGVKVMKILEKIQETDMKNKGVDNPNTPPAELMKELLFFIMH